MKWEDPRLVYVVRERSPAILALRSGGGNRRAKQELTFESDMPANG